MSERYWRCKVHGESILTDKAHDFLKDNSACEWESVEVWPIGTVARLRACHEWLCMLILSHERHTKETANGSRGGASVQRQEPGEGTVEGFGVSQETSEDSRSIQRASEARTSERSGGGEGSETDEMRKLRMGWRTPQSSRGLFETVRSEMVVLSLSREAAQDIVDTARAALAASVEEER